MEPWNCGDPQIKVHKTPRQLGPWVTPTGHTDSPHDDGTGWGRCAHYALRLTQGIIMVDSGLIREFQCGIVELASVGVCFLRPSEKKSKSGTTKNVTF